MTHRTLAVYLPNMASGGIERMIINLAPAFIAAGLNVTFVLQQVEGALLPLVPPGVKIVTLHCSRTLTSILPLARYLAREQPDWLLSSLGHNNIMALWAQLLSRARTRIIISQHRALSAESKQFANWQHRVLPLLYRWCLPYANSIVAVSAGVADDLAKTAGIARERIEVIYNPVIADGFENRMHEPVDHPWLADGEPPFLLAVGRLVEQKDFSTLIAAFVRIGAARNLRLIILGEGPLHGAFEELIQSHGLSDRVSLPGFQANPLPFMAKAAAFVMSSRFEGFGNVLVEALACGTPVVSTDCPYGPAEILASGRFGTLVPIGNAEALSAAIGTTLDNPLPHDVLKARGREFTVERCAKGYLELFKKLERTPSTLNTQSPVV